MHKRRHSGLWWLAFLIAASGGALSYYISQQEMNPAAQQNIALVLAFTAVGAGICIISATADWWMHR